MSWNTIVEPLRERHLVLACIFSAYIWFMLFVALDVITGALWQQRPSGCGERSRDHRDGHPGEQEKQLINAWKSFNAIVNDMSA